MTVYEMKLGEKEKDGVLMFNDFHDEAKDVGKDVYVWPDKFHVLLIKGPKDSTDIEPLGTVLKRDICNLADKIPRISGSWAGQLPKRKRNVFSWIRSWLPPVCCVIGLIVLVLGCFY